MSSSFAEWTPFLADLIRGIKPQMMLKARYGSLTFEIEENQVFHLEEMETVACPTDLRRSADVVFKENSELVFEEWHEVPPALRSAVANWRRLKAADGSHSFLSASLKLDKELHGPHGNIENPFPSEGLAVTSICRKHFNACIHHRLFKWFASSLLHSASNAHSPLANGLEGNVRTILVLQINDCAQ